MPQPSLGDEYTIAEEADISLDRSAINHHGQVKLVEHQAGQASVDEASDYENASKEDKSRLSLHRMKDSVNERRHQAASKIKKAVYLESRDKNLKIDTGDTRSPILAKDVTKQTDSRIDSAQPVPDKHTVKDFLHNPVQTTRTKFQKESSHEVAANIAAKEVSHGQEVDLVKAEDAVKDAKTEKERNVALQNRNDLIKQRQTLFIRWTLDRHVTKIRLLPRETFVRKPRTEFGTTNAQGKFETDWQAYSHHLMLYAAHQYGGQYIGYGNSPPVPSKETIMPNIERVLIASAPFQEFIMTMRRVYRWENRRETTKYLLIYLTLWTFDLLLPGMLSAIVYFVIQRRFHKMTLEDLRNDLKRTEDVHETAMTFSEFIEKKGDEQWADKLIQDLGPWLMVQLCDMANFFEVLLNFYEWRVPHRTLFTLALFTLTIIITLTVSARTLVKSLTLSAGIAFFALFPIATNFSDYRLLTSPIKRIFWNIPTHSEWAIKSIQAEGTRYQHERTTPSSSSPSDLDAALTNPSSSNLPNEHDYDSYTSHHDKSKGRLIVSDASIRFVSNIGHKVHFILPYDQITQLEKIDRWVRKAIPKPSSDYSDSGQDLRVVDRQGEERVLANVDTRDQAFSQIVGFSDTVWQVMW
ncbi:hypothetical protein K491DRAFT_652742 [Lophiostoma macrostomum CBS 122681]|uniref:Uncharacterized protein n=1 Tax=Lophiostoma macrostomum CBS 122681 TaxID=1314788 RepID=A0A6A6TEU0_9PLEO|nr:hypothetical protein K491DRAFT_652742 [Lophiostoma macrostomum CBS 122681]